MSGEPFDPGAVLSRARPVLTFTSAVRTGGSVAASAASLGGRSGASRSASAGMRPRVDTPTPGGVSLTDAAATRARVPQLPVIARIVREGPLDRGPLAALRARMVGVGHALRRSGVGALVVGALGLATLGAIAGLGMRSLSDEAAIANAAPPSVTLTRSYDAVATERLLSRAPLSDRVDRTGTTSTETAAVSASAPCRRPRRRPRPRPRTRPRMRTRSRTRPRTRPPPRTRSLPRRQPAPPPPPTPPARRAAPPPTPLLAPSPRPTTPTPPPIAPAPPPPSHAADRRGPRRGPERSAHSTPLDRESRVSGSPTPPRTCILWDCVTNPRRPIPPPQPTPPRPRSPSVVRARAGAPRLAVRSSAVVGGPPAGRADHAPHHRHPGHRAQAPLVLPLVLPTDRPRCSSATSRASPPCGS